eukprot:TRINITY_DN4032_c0_g2_i2.p2 TRINITY_DN4032_c0_g2~~TRINITY_DN4032_c0_g2_i2.p2  ORF type:complete len:111 (+),score=19.32 TRINITY_DN4032_c0_g2_i2:402-734(+)
MSSLQPLRNAMEMEGVIANAPSNGAIFTRWCILICLAFNTKIHNVVAADGTVVDNNVPCPETNGIPLFDFKAFCLFLRDLSTRAGGADLHAIAVLCHCLWKILRCLPLIR